MRSMTLDEFCDVIGLNHNQRRGDLDGVTARSAPMIARSLGIPSVCLAAFTLPPGLVRSTWDPSGRRHGATMRVCPRCLWGQDGHAKRWWRYVFAEVCPVHGIWLAWKCANCGEPVRHRSQILDLHWLDAWPFCANCGFQMQSSPSVPPPILTATRRWEAAFAGRSTDGLDPGTVHVLSRRINGFFTAHP